MKHRLVVVSCAALAIAAAAGCSTTAAPPVTAPTTAPPARSTPAHAAPVKSKAIDAAVDHLLNAYHQYGSLSPTLSEAIRRNEKATSDLYLASAALLPPPTGVPADETHHGLFALHRARDGLRDLNRCLSNVIATDAVATTCIAAKVQANKAMSEAFLQIFALARYGTRTRRELEKLVTRATSG
jgi:hypothetical protein